MPFVSYLQEYFASIEVETNVSTKVIDFGLLFKQIVYQLNLTLLKVKQRINRGTTSIVITGIIYIICNIERSTIILL